MNYSNYIIHGDLHDVIDYKRLIEAQANSYVDMPIRVVNSKRKYNKLVNKSINNTIKSSYHIKMLRR